MKNNVLEKESSSSDWDHAHARRSGRKGDHIQVICSHVTFPPNVHYASSVICSSLSFHIIECFSNLFCTYRGLLDHTKERIVQAVRSFVPPELKESGLDLDVGDARKSESASRKKKPPRPAAEKPLSRQGSAKTRVKNPVLDDHESFEKGRDENTAQNRSRPGSGKDSRPDSAISRASKLRSAVGSTSRENLSSTESSTGAIPRIRIGATHVEATKNKSLPAGCTCQDMLIFLSATIY